jgi:hypothetical protein
MVLRAVMLFLSDGAFYNDTFIPTAAMGGKDD